MSQKIITEIEVASKIIDNIKPIIIISRILGTVPYKYTGTGKVTLKPIRIIYAGFIVGLYVVGLLYILFKTELFTASKKDVSQITHLFNILFESLLFIVAITFGLFRSRQIAVRLVNLIRTDKSLVKLGVDVSFEETKKFIKILMIIYTLILIIMFTTDYLVCFVYNIEEGIQFVQWIFLVILFVYNRLIQLQFFNLILFLNKRFKALNTEMKNLKAPDVYETNIRKTNPKLNTDKSSMGLPLKQKIRLMKEIHDLLTGLCNQANELASVRILLHIAVNTVTITSHMYVIASMMIDNKYQWHIFGYSIYWCLFRASDLFMIIYMCANTSNQANHTAIVIHDLLSSGEMVEISEELEHFSIQLLHHKICFTACDFFPIDITLIYSNKGLSHLMNVASSYHGFPGILTYFLFIQFTSVNELEVPRLEWHAKCFSGIGMLMYTVTIYSVRKATSNHLIPWSNQEASLMPSRFPACIAVIEDPYNLHMAGTVATYLIILIQFKLSS